MISCGSDAHRCHHARTKSLLFLKSELCIMHFASYLGAHQSCVPQFFNHFWQKKGCPKRYTFEKVKKKWWFRVRGAHIDVTTLERKAYFFEN